MVSHANESQRDLNQSRQSVNNSNYAPSSKASEGTNRSKVSKKSKQKVAQPKPDKANIRGDPTGHNNLEKEFNSKEGSFSEYENLLAPM